MRHTLARNDDHEGHHSVEFLDWKMVYYGGSPTGRTGQDAA